MSFFSFQALLAAAFLALLAPASGDAQIRDGRLPGRDRVIIDQRSDEDSDEDSDQDSDEDSDSDSDSDDNRRARTRGGSRSGDVCIDRDRDGLCDVVGRRRDRRRDACVDRNRDGRCDGTARRRMDEILGAVIRGRQYLSLLTSRGA